MLKNDKWIIEQAKKGMIEPFEPSLLRTISLESSAEVPALRLSL